MPGKIIGRPIRIAVVANCQARPLAYLLSMLAPQVEIVGVTITHLAKLSDEAEALRLYDDADYIFAQLVQDTYPTPFLRTRRLKQRYDNKVVSWPNIFYRGQCPELCYITRPGIGRILSPLGEYHNIFIYEAWRDGMSVSDTVSMFSNGGDWLERLIAEPEKSLEELKSRETDLDTTISSEISENWRTKRLFFTSNHPSSWLLETVARRLLNRISCDIQEDPAIHKYGEPLDRIIPALLPVVADQLGLNLPTGTLSKGCEIHLAEEVRLGKSVIYYELNELVEISFRALERQLTPDTPVRVS